MVSVLIIIDNPVIDRYAIENLLRYSAGVELEILAVNNTGDPSVMEFLAHIVKSEDKTVNLVALGEIDEITYNKPAAFNKLIKEAKGDYICVFESNILVGPEWIYDLRHYHSLIDKVGATAIPTSDVKKVYTGLIDKNDEIVNVWKSADNSVSGVALFKNDLLNPGNCFNEEVEVGFLTDFTLKINKLGKFENFYDVRNYFQI